MDDHHIVIQNFFYLIHTFPILTKAALCYFFTPKLYLFINVHRKERLTCFNISVFQKVDLLIIF